jgi:hypothetical protein
VRGTGGNEECRGSKTGKVGEGLLICRCEKGKQVGRWRIHSNRD